MRGEPVARVQTVEDEEPKEWMGIASIKCALLVAKEMDASEM